MVSIALVLVATLVPDPYRVEQTSLASNTSSLIVGPGFSTVGDVVKNLLLFVPLGYAFAGPDSRRVFYVVSLGFALSYGIEIVQGFMPGRFPSLFDVFANTTGAAVGAIIRHAHAPRRQ